MLELEAVTALEAARKAEAGEVARASLAVETAAGAFVTCARDHHREAKIPPS